MPFSLINMSDTELAHAMWTFTGGAILFLLQSIYSQTIRNWWSLLMGCAIGGIGATVAGHIWADSEWVFAICGVAAVVSANVLQGLMNVTGQFAENPIRVGSYLAKTFLPTFGKKIGDITIDTKDLK